MIAFAISSRGLNALEMAILVLIETVDILSASARKALRGDQEEGAASRVLLVDGLGQIRMGREGFSFCSTTIHTEYAKEHVTNLGTKELSIEMR